MTSKGILGLSALAVAAVASLRPVSPRFDSITLSTGVRLHYAEQGNAQGEAVILLPGYSDSWFSYSRILPLLPDQYRVFALDLRGHGDSEKPATGYQMHELAADVLAFMDAKHLVRATVVGHSLGGFVAQQVALAAPHRVSRLVLVSTAASARDFAGIHEFRQVVEGLTDPVPDEFAREFQRSTLRHPVPDEFLNTVVATSRKMPAAVWRAIFDGMLAAEPAVALGRARIPTLVMWGDQDAYPRRDAQDRLVAMLGSARLHVYRDLGHAPHWERPEAFARDLRAFLATTPAAGETRIRDGATAGSPGPASTPERRIRLDRVEVSTGVRVHYAEQGNPAGEPIVLVHGYGDAWVSWRRVLPLIPDAYRVYALDLRGHGDSDKPASGYRMADMAADVLAFMDAKGIGRATVVGHSMGGLVAQALGDAAPDRVSRLVLVGTLSTGRHIIGLGDLQQLVATVSDPASMDFARQFQTGMTAMAVPEAFMNEILASTVKVPARAWRGALDGLVAMEPAVTLGRRGIPTLVIWGDRDPLSDRAEQERLVNMIGTASLTVYEATGHCPNWERPEALARDLLEFIAATPRRGPVGGAMAEPVPAPRESGGHAHGHAPAHTGPMPLLSGLGTLHHPVTTASPAAQQYFDQGMRLAYAFNHDEAVRSFEAAARLDPSCAMCQWGIAYALGPNINLPMDTAAERRALVAIREGQRRARGVTTHERAYIHALSTRYAEPIGANRAARDSAYARAMRQVARAYRKDADAQVLFADALLNLRPWDQWTRDGRPQAGTEEVVATLERALRTNPEHAGACHFYIHTVEASPTPERALACAERLPRLMPGAGHVVHMPAHVYLRVGRYHDAARANIDAAAADSAYFAARGAGDGIYRQFYAPHNLHFQWAAYLLSGQRLQARRTAGALVRQVSVDDARAVASLEAFLPVPILTALRFGDATAVLAESGPPADLRYARGMWHYARGMAQAAIGDTVAARASLDSVRAIAAAAPDDLIIILNAAPALLRLASETLAGTIEARRGNSGAAVQHLRTATRLEDELTYDEPPPWYHSSRQRLGCLLLGAGRAAEAEAVFADDLRWLPENGWSLAGLADALRAQGKDDAATDVEQRLRAAWRWSDVGLAGVRCAR